MDGNNQETKPAALSSFTCLGCGAPVAIRAAGITVTAVCSACGSVSENKDGDFKLIKKSHDLLMKVQPAIALGTKGKLRGQVYQVIGFMKRFDKEYPDQPWQEYLLFNPFLGYAWLAESKGHWTLYKVTKNIPHAETSRTYSFLGETYHVYQKGTAVVDFVVGEFYWRVHTGETAKTLDAISPPHIISLEAHGDESIWSVGDYIDPSEIVEAFHPPRMPDRVGIAPNQPAKVKSLNDIWATWILAIFCLLAIQVMAKSLKPETTLEPKSFLVENGDVNDLEIANFVVSDLSTHTTVVVTTNIQQSWATIKIHLLPEDMTNSTDIHFEKDVSYYYGYDDGESWSEGSNNAEFLINKLPRGRYRIYASVSPEKGHSLSVSTYVRLAPSVWSNFWLAMLLITLVPAWMTFRSSSFEHSRWRDSDYSPYDQQSN